MVWRLLRKFIRILKNNLTLGTLSVSRSEQFQNLAGNQAKKIKNKRLGIHTEEVQSVRVRDRLHPKNRFMNLGV